MNIEIIKQQIEIAGNEFYITGGVSDSLIDKINNLLNIELPDDYRWYLKNYGSGGIAGTEIIGIAYNEALECVDVTKRYQMLGLKNNYLVFYDAGESVYCLDLNNSNSKKSPIIMWDTETDDYIKIYCSFLECVGDLFKEELANL